MTDIVARLRAKADEIDSSLSRQLVYEADKARERAAKFGNPAKNLSGFNPFYAKPDWQQER